VVDRLAHAPVVAQDPGEVGDVVVVGEDHAGVTDRPERLGGEEREHTRPAEQAGVHTVPPHADRLGAVLDQHRAGPVGHLGDRVHVGHLAEQVHRHDRPGTVADDRRQRVRVHGIAVRLDVDEHRLAARQHHRRGRREEGVDGHRHLVARLDAAGAQGEDQPVGAVVDGDRMPGAGVGGDRALELGHLAPMGVLAAVHDLADVRADRGPQRLERLRLREERYGRGLDRC
jgi:hypothetical protein